MPGEESPAFGDEGEEAGEEFEDMFGGGSTVAIPLASDASAEF